MPESTASPLTNPAPKGPLLSPFHSDDVPGRQVDQRVDRRGAADRAARSGQHRLGSSRCPAPPARARCRNCLGVERNQLARAGGEVGHDEGRVVAVLQLDPVHDARVGGLVLGVLDHVEVLDRRRPRAGEPLSRHGVHQFVKPLRVDRAGRHDVVRHQPDVAGEDAVDEEGVALAGVVRERVGDRGRGLVEGLHRTPCSPGRPSCEVVSTPSVPFSSMSHPKIWPPSALVSTLPSPTLCSASDAKGPRLAEEAASGAARAGADETTCPTSTHATSRTQPGRPTFRITTYPPNVVVEGRTHGPGEGFDRSRATRTTSAGHHRSVTQPRLRARLSRSG